METLYDKHTVLDYLWQYSKFTEQCLYQSEELYRSDRGYSAVIVLFNCVENVAKSVVNDYNSKLEIVFRKLFDNNIISKTEHDFLNSGNTCIRKIRNLYALANISAINFVIHENGKEVFWPLTENDTSLWLYSKTSDILYNLILKIIVSSFVDEIKSNFNICLDNYIKHCDIKLKIFTAKELLVLKGYPEDYFPGKLNIPEHVKYRLIDNAPDVNVLEKIIKG